MEADEFFNALAHPTRRHIVKLLALNKTMSYTDIMEALRLSETGKISFHLKKMEILLSHDAEKRYMLSPLGTRAMHFISEVESSPSPSPEMTGSRIAGLPRRAASYLVDLLFILFIYSTIGQTETEVVSEIMTQKITTQFWGIYFRFYGPTSPSLKGIAVRVWGKCFSG